MWCPEPPNPQRLTQYRQSPSPLGLKGLVSPQRPRQPMVCAPTALRTPESSQGRSPVVRWPLEGRNLTPALVPQGPAVILLPIESLTRAVS